MIKQRLQRFAAVALTLSGLVLLLHTPVQATWQYCAHSNLLDIWAPGPATPCGSINSQGECTTPIICEDTRYAWRDDHVCARSNIKCQKCVTAPGYVRIHRQHTLGACEPVNGQCFCPSDFNPYWVDIARSDLVPRNCRTTNPCLGLN